ncbi:uncharacterized protein TRAVEDRAFT_30970 [Trametes versicolor FP-101664 SS1]|uniref:uncharacterized protein n=1 Tax=Trametes versicolor (strain FP-101664) TaxID=717944 RepID=UPI0004623DAC|nr:uncharacterized protein TRAVEDRAFT_30970 [Trametes versicolor FP-101664 SS1]EIW55088.1 hypothetical protein TRAVEDRAFT_30970 [Trametes versicolor FP-101664 SS1]
MAHAQKPSVDSEIHELNAEADFLEAKTTIVPHGVNGEDTKLQAHNSDPDAQAMVIESLRAQVQDLFSQVTQLNNKLVRSYDRVSDLEDELHVTSSNLRQTTLKISQLELERTQHLSALSTGLLVEKSHVTTELNRLMERATEEAARRGQAESARHEIEQELDDLSAGLFNQANTMVAEARMAAARSARKLEETETALRGAEEIVGVLQAQMQALQAEKEQADVRVEEMRGRMGKGKWVDRSPDGGRPHRPRLLSTHVPYHEFLVFISHLRAIRPASAQPPAMSTLLPLPLLARLVAEDSDPTVRLDLAPSLNWLSRRSVLAAIHNGQLTVEPMQFATLLEELAPPSIPASSHNTHIVCALCGIPIYSNSSDSPATTPTTPNAARSGSQSASWSTALFKNVRAGDITLPTSFTGNGRHSAQFALTSSEPPSQVYIFRLEGTSSGLPVSLPLSTQPPGTPTRQSTIYPLCTSGWCLARLRMTCSLWAFVRTGIVEKVWEEPPFTDRPNPAQLAMNGADKKHDGTNGVGPAPAIPPRRSKIGLGSIWGSMQRSLSGTREPEKDAAKPREPPKDDVRPKLPPRDPSRKSLPPPPPVHPSIASHAPTKSVGGQVHSVPPPPLPRRNKGRDTTPAVPEPELKLAEAEAPNGQAQPVDEAPAAEPRASTEEQPKEAPVPPTTELLVPPTQVSRTESQDSFTTPTEELAPPFSVSPAPTAVPLPPSQAPSPEPQETEQPPSETAETGTPSEATPAPTPAPAVPPTVTDDKPPSRTASPVPPPLPRRAAARARPSSVSVPQAAEEAKAASAEPAAQASEGEAAVENGADASVPAEGAAQTELSVPVTEEPEPIASESEAVEPPAQADVPVVSADAKSEEKHEPQVNGDSVPPAPESDAKDEPVEAEEAEKEKEDEGQYVGDATWEERTYKELVRLREEMFWARVGAVVH